MAMQRIGGAVRGKVAARFAPSALCASSVAPASRVSAGPALAAGTWRPPTAPTEQTTLCARTASVRAPGARWFASEAADSGDAEERRAAALARAQSKKLKIYTKTGDKGSSSLYNGSRAGKGNNPVFAALGDVDELNAFLGLAGEYCRQGHGFLHALREGSAYARAVGVPEGDLPTGGSGGGGTGTAAGEPRTMDVPAQLVEIQSRLLDVGSALATPLDSSSEEQLERVHFADEHVEKLEAWIDVMEDQLPALRNFILPVRMLIVLCVLCGPKG